MFMTVLFVCSLPFLTIVWVIIPEAAEEFMDGMEDLLETRMEDIKAHRNRIIRLYEAQSTSNDSM